MAGVRWKRWLTVAVLVVLAALLTGSFLVTRTIDEFYSPDRRSENSMQAKARGVFVHDVSILPAAVPIADAVDLRVIDAWVERPTRVRYRWNVLPTEIQDSAFRLVVRAAHVPRDGGETWSPALGRCFAFYDVRLDGQPVTTSGGLVSMFDRRSALPFSDTIALSVVRRGNPGTPPGAAPVENRCPDSIPVKRATMR